MSRVFEQQVLRGARDPLPALSFEANVQTVDISHGCLVILGGQCEFAWSQGEGMQLDTDWVGESAIRDILASAEQFGDVYARLR